MNLVGLANLSTSASEITVTNIPQNATNLLLRASVRGTDTGVGVQVRMRINGDTGNSYIQKFYTRVPVNGESNVNTVGNSAPVGMVISGSLTSVFSGVEIEFPYYRTGGFKVGWCSSSAMDNSTTTMRWSLGGAGWNNGGAISSVTLFPSAGSFQAGTRLAVYTF
jgi:hypothetical protein